MESTKSTMKDKIGQTVGIILFFVIIFSFIYYKFIAEPEPQKNMSAQEQRELEKKLIDRYGSLENAEEVYRQQNDREGSGSGHPLWNE